MYVYVYVWLMNERVCMCVCVYVVYGLFLIRVKISEKIVFPRASKKIAQVCLIEIYVRKKIYDNEETKWPNDNIKRYWFK